MRARAQYRVGASKSSLEGVCNWFDCLASEQGLPAVHSVMGDRNTGILVWEGNDEMDIGGGRDGTMVGSFLIDIFIGRYFF